jgi:hypothetical protein
LTYDRQSSLLCQHSAAHEHLGAPERPFPPSEASAPKAGHTCRQGLFWLLVVVGEEKIDLQIERQPLVADAAADEKLPLITKRATYLKFVKDVALWTVRSAITTLKPARVGKYRCGCSESRISAVDLLLMLRSLTACSIRFFATSSKFTIA